jgi:hypothetical protein
MAETKGGPPQGPSGNEAAAPEAKLTKREAVLRALAELGQGAGRTQIRDWVKGRYGIDVSLDHISTTKVEAAGKPPKKKKKKKSGAKAAAGPTAEAGAARAAAGAAPAPAAPPARAEKANTKGGVALEDVVAVKALLARVGPEHLRALIEVLSR